MSPHRQCSRLPAAPQGPRSPCALRSHLLGAPRRASAGARACGGITAGEAASSLLTINDSVTAESGEAVSEPPWGGAEWGALGAAERGVWAVRTASLLLPEAPPAHGGHPAKASSADSPRTVPRPWGGTV